MAVLMVLSLLPVSALAGDGDDDTKTYRLVFDYTYSSVGDWEQVMDFTFIGVDVPYDLEDSSVSFTYDEQDIIVRYVEPVESVEYDISKYKYSNDDGWEVYASFEEEILCSVELKTGEGDACAQYVRCEHELEKLGPANCNEGGVVGSPERDIFQCVNCIVYFWDDGGSEPLTEQDVNSYISEALGHDFSSEECEYVIGEGDNAGQHTRKCIRCEAEDPDGWEDHDFSQGDCVCKANASAQIGTTGYATLAAAIEAAKNNDIVTLLKDCDEAINNTLTASITIDGNGKKLTGGMKLTGSGSNKVTVQNFRFETGGLDISGFDQTTVTNNGFQNITEYYYETYPAALHVVDNSQEDNVITITDNTFENWGNSGDSRALFGEVNSKLIFTGNVMKAGMSGVSVAYVELASSSNRHKDVDVSHNYWDGNDPTGMVGDSVWEFYDGFNDLLDIHSYYADEAKTDLKEYVAGNLHTQKPYILLATALSEADAEEDQTVTLLKDCEENITVNNKVTLDLNGFVLIACSDEGSVITVNSGADLTVTDSSEGKTHNFTVETDGLWVLDEEDGTETVTGGVITGDAGLFVRGVKVNDGIFTMNGGNIVGNKSNGSGGGVHVTGGSFTMTGGNIVGNRSDESGGGVHVTGDGSFTMNGGNIAGNKTYGEADSGGGGVNVTGGSSFTMNGGNIVGNMAEGGHYSVGGGVRVADGSFTMINGAIKNNTASQYGGGVFANGEFTMTGGIISGNTVNNGSGGGLYINDNADVTLGGTAKIVNNKAGTDLAANNVDTNTGLIKLGTDANAPQDMSIGVYKTGKFTAASFGAAAAKDFFTSDRSGYTVKCNDNGTPDDTADDYLELVGGYAITVDSAVRNGSITVASSAYSGEVVTLTVVPDPGCQLTENSLKVTYKRYGQEHTCKLTPGKGNTYTFTMPAYDVTVTAAFEEEVPTTFGNGNDGKKFRFEKDGDTTFIVFTAKNTVQGRYYALDYKTSEEDEWIGGVPTPGQDGNTELSALYIAGALYRIREVKGITAGNEMPLYIADVISYYPWDTKVEIVIAANPAVSEFGDILDKPIAVSAQRNYKIHLYDNLGCTVSDVLEGKSLILDMKEFPDVRGKVSLTLAVDGQPCSLPVEVMIDTTAEKGADGVLTYDITDPSQMLPINHSWRFADAQSRDSNAITQLQICENEYEGEPFQPVNRQSAWVNEGVVRWIPQPYENYETPYQLILTVSGTGGIETELKANFHVHYHDGVQYPIVAYVGEEGFTTFEAAWNYLESSELEGEERTICIVGDVQTEEVIMMSDPDFGAEIILDDGAVFDPSRQFDDQENEKPVYDENGKLIGFSYEEGGGIDTDLYKFVCANPDEAGSVAVMGICHKTGVVNVDSKVVPDNALAINGNTGVAYNFLEAAVKEAKDNETIILLADVPQPDRNVFLYFKDNVTLDLNNHTITGGVADEDCDYDYEDGTAYIYEGKGLTIKNGTMTGVEGSGVTENYAYGAYIGNHNDDVDTYVTDNVTIQNVTFTNGGFNLYKAGAVTIKDCNVTVGETNKYYSVYVENGTVEIDGGTYGAGTNGNVIYADNNSTVTIKDGKFTGNLVKRDVATARFSVEGGLYSKKPAEGYVADGKHVMANTASTTKNEYPWTVGEAVASITKGGTTTYYVTLADAVAEAKNGDTVTLVMDAQGGGVMLKESDAKSITIDLNGKTYTFSEPAVGSTGTENQGFHFEKGNTVTVKNGTLAVNEADTAKFRFVIQNYADLTLDGVTVDGRQLGIADKSHYTVSNNCGNVTIKNTTIIAANGEKDFALDTCKYGSYAVPTVKVEGNSTLTGNVELSGGNLALNSGKLNGALTVPEGTIIGKVTKNENFAAEAPEGYKWVNGRLVSTDESVAKNITKDKTYATLSEALDEAASGDTINLLKDLTGDKKVSLVEVAPGVTLDLNGHNLEAKTAMAWGLVKNSSSTGKLITAQDRFAYFDGKEMAASDENVMPVWDTNGYVFYAVTEIWEQWRIELGSEDGNPKYRFQPRSSEISKILAENSGVKVYAEFNYTKNGHQNHLLVEFGQTYITDFLTNPTELVMYVSLLGTDDVTSITANAYLKAENCNFSIKSTSVTTTRND